MEEKRTTVLRFGKGRAEAAKSGHPERKTTEGSAKTQKSLPSGPSPSFPWKKGKPERLPPDTFTRRADAPDAAALVCAVIAAVFFLGSFSGGLRGDAAAVDALFEGGAVPVMSGAVESGSENTGVAAKDPAKESSPVLKERLRKAGVPSEAPSDEAFGYLEGKWNLWEYIGDVMADLLLH